MDLDELTGNLQGKTLRVWMITDGKIGDDVQCEAVASCLSLDFERRVVSPGAPWAWLAPAGPVAPRDYPHKQGSPIAPPFPDIAIVSGRRAVPYAIAVKRSSGRKTKIVCLKDPRMRRGEFDLIWAPDHDQLSGVNVFSTLTSPHGLAGKIVAARKTPIEQFSTNARPILGVVLGGPSGGAKYDAAMADALAAHLNQSVKSFASIAITPSRRTPASFIEALAQNLLHQSFFIWDGRGANPYVDILANSDALLVTADSHNMMSEAVSTGTGVYVFRPRGNAAKLDHFVTALVARGGVREIDDVIAPFNAPPIDATREIVDEICRRLTMDYLADTGSAGNAS